jgi:hypothetical protein
MTWVCSPFLSGTTVNAFYGGVNNTRQWAFSVDCSGASPVMTATHQTFTANIANTWPTVNAPSQDGTRDARAIRGGSYSTLIVGQNTAQETPEMISSLIRPRYVGDGIGFVSNIAGVGNTACWIEWVPNNSSTGYGFQKWECIA